MICRARHTWLHRTALAGAAMAVLALLLPTDARADADADAKIARLLDLLVQKKIVSAKQAHELFRETEAAPKPARHPPVTIGEAQPEPPKNGEIRVTYVPQFVRKQIADEVRAQVMTEAQQEGWAAPDALPEWTKRFKLYGDMRFRYEIDDFNSGNYNQFVNFASINNGSAFDFSNYANGSVSPPPFLDTTQNRDRFRIRARLGMQALIDDGLTADIRIGTGADNGPVTPNQTLGSPGDFSKYNAYIDRAYFTYKPLQDLTFYLGREPNPFFTTDLIFYSDLGFDGGSMQYTPQILDNVGLFFNGGAFPVLNTAFDFATTSDVKYKSANAYMLAIQAGAKWQISSDLSAKIGVGLFDFTGVQGSVSQPCTIQLGSTFNCNTDNTRFPFESFGNTVFAIRNIVTAGQPGTTPSQPEYFGLASKFNVLEIHPRVDITTYHPFDVAVEGEYLKNLAYNRSAILTQGPPNFIGPQNNLGNNNVYEGGSNAYIIKATLGHLEIHRRWDWNVTVAYKYLETDSTLDSIDDSDFHLGGTNAKGYILTGSLGVARDTYLSLRYFSSQVVSGPPDGNNVFQVDLQSTF